MTEESGAQVVKLFGNDRSKLGTLFFNNTHDNVTYGTLVAYLRLKGLAPLAGIRNPPSRLRVVC